MKKFLIPLMIIFVLFPTYKGMAQNIEKGIGVNVSQIRDWSKNFPFLDLFTLSRPWIPQRQGVKKWNTGEKLSVDSNGWINRLDEGQIATTLIQVPLEGTYYLFHEGEGELRLRGKNIGRLNKINEGKYSFTAIPNQTVIISIRKTNPENYIKNISVVHEEFKNTYKDVIFNPVYLEYLKPFKALRFAFWERNKEPKKPFRTEPLEWNERTLPEHASQATYKGVALEYIVKFANKINKSIWISIPHRASDDFIRNYARYLKKHLNPNLQIYLEYSNEVWNRTFVQHRYIQEKSQQEKAKHWSETYLKRSDNIFKIFEDEFQKDKRIINVVSGQFVNISLTKKILNNPQYLKRAHAFAIAPYVGNRIGRKTPLTQADTDLIFHLMNMELEDVFIPKTQETKSLAQKAGLDLISYEGGQHLTAQQKNNKKASICAFVNNDPRMGKFYSEYLKKWDELVSGNIFFLFNDASKYSRHGCWGLSNSIYPDQGTFPKYDAVTAFINELHE